MNAIKNRFQSAMTQSHIEQQCEQQVRTEFRRSLLMEIERHMTAHRLMRAKYGDTVFSTAPKTAALALYEWGLQEHLLTLTDRPRFGERERS